MKLLNQVIVDTLVLAEVDKPFYTNLGTYIRTYDNKTMSIKWRTKTFDSTLYTRYDNVWKRTQQIENNRYNTPYVDGDIPDIEQMFQKLKREDKLKRICKICKKKLYRK